MTSFVKIRICNLLSNYSGFPSNCSSNWTVSHEFVTELSTSNSKPVGNPFAQLLSLSASWIFAKSDAVQRIHTTHPQRRRDSWNFLYALDTKLLFMFFIQEINALYKKIIIYFIHWSVVTYLLYVNIREIALIRKFNHFIRERRSQYRCLHFIFRYFNSIFSIFQLFLLFSKSNNTHLLIVISPLNIVKVVLLKVWNQLSVNKNIIFILQYLRNILKW